MKITVDLNVLLDVAQNRQPFYQSSEEVLHPARAGEFAAVLPAHALTTLHYIIEKWSGTKLANETIDRLLADFCNHSVGILGNHPPVPNRNSSTARRKNPFAPPAAGVIDSAYEL